MEKIRILMVSPYYWPYCSGVTEYVRRLAEELVNKDFDVSVFTTRHKPSLKKKEIINGVEVIRNKVLFRLSKGVVSPFFVLRGTFVSKDYDYVNLHLPMFESGIFSILMPKHKLIATYHCDLTLNKNLFEKIIEFFYYLSARLCLIRASKIVTYTKDYVLNSKILSRFAYKTSYIYPIVDYKHFKPKSKHKYKSKFGISSNDYVVGFIGRLVFEKGLSYFLDSIPEILNAVPNTKFILAGNYKDVAGGSIYPELKNKIEKYEDKIIVAGQIEYENLPCFYSACDVIMLPSTDKMESFGIVQLESMLCSTPVVASDIPGVRVPINKTGMGLLAKPKNSNSIADAIIKILRKPKVFVKPRNKIVKTFSKDHVIAAYRRYIFRK